MLVLSQLVFVLGVIFFRHLPNTFFFANATKTINLLNYDNSQIVGELDFFENGYLLSFIPDTGSNYFIIPSCNMNRSDKDPIYMHIYKCIDTQTHFNYFKEIQKKDIQYGQGLKITGIAADIQLKSKKFTLYVNSSIFCSS